MPRAPKGRDRAGAPSARPRGTRAKDPAHVRRRLEYVVGELGNNHVARILPVAESQPSRWRSGEERLSEPNRRHVFDLDYVMSRLLELYPKDVAALLILSHNAPPPPPPIH